MRTSTYKTKSHFYEININDLHMVFFFVLLTIAKTFGCNENENTNM